MLVAMCSAIAGYWYLDVEAKFLHGPGAGSGGMVALLAVIVVVVDLPISVGAEE